ncbi:MAG: AAA family ATPase [Phycisphaerae bacterium]|nr:AAA family ATPase [Phycisphaerae bacterium]
MIKSVKFTNFKALRDTTLPLGQFTLIIGPNASGKSTALQGLVAAIHRSDMGGFARVASAHVRSMKTAEVSIIVQVEEAGQAHTYHVGWSAHGGFQVGHDIEELGRFRSITVFSLDAQAIAAPVQLRKGIVIGVNGSHLAGVLDRMRDGEPERFEALNEELGRWLPEFDRILFDIPADNQRAFQLRTREGQHTIPATDLSQGTLLSLTMLTLAHLQEPPRIICLEEPDRGIHPRLLRQVQDALYRLSYPEHYGETRPPSQVIVTTHSPVMLDLYRDHPEEIVVANKVGMEVKFERLSDQPNIREILDDGHLGDIWYTGILGGVPLES